jgi:hypothetical protein
MGGTRRKMQLALSESSVLRAILALNQAPPMVVKELIAPGWIKSENAELARCWVKNISKLGATIEPQCGQPPDQFRLYFSQYAVTFRRCEVEWRKENSVGVKFVGGIYRDIPTLIPDATLA